MQNSPIKNKAVSEYPHIPTFVLLLFSGYVILWYLQVGVRKPALGNIRIEFLWAIGLSVFAIMYSTAKSYRNPLKPYLILYFFVIIIQVPFSYNLDYSWKIFVDRIIKFAFMAWFIISFVKGPKGLVFFLCAFMLACMKMGQEGFVGQITGSLVWQNQGVMRLHGPTPMYAHPNSFSGMAVGTLPFVIAFFPIVNKWVKMVLAVQLVFSVNIILFSASRTSYVAICLLGFIVFLRSRRKILILVMCFVISTVAISYIPEQYIQRFESIYTMKEAEGASTEKRIQILKDAWEIFISHPLGVGVGAFPFIRRDVFGRVQDTHNLYLEVATNLGIQGVVVFVFFISKLLIVLYKLERAFNSQISAIENNVNEIINDKELMDRHLFHLKLFRSTAQSGFYFICARLFLGLFGMDLYEIYWWFAIGSAIALYNICNRSEKITIKFTEKIT